ncbi:MAG: hypothetical protein M3Q56_06440 [Bacteroidota bacterium]|nr:hypothetical protein [Bacteroidota bacterium]
MPVLFTNEDRTLAIQRLTALWAFNECGLGGFLHAINSPFTGLVVGSIAMLCIAGISYFSDQKFKTVMTSLLIVLIIKGLVSPHSTPTAYLAVTFQAITGAVFYRYIPGLLFSSILFVTIGQLESAFQRLLTLTILYGNPLWKAVDMWGEYVTKRWSIILPVSASQFIIMVYVIIHFITGIVVGWMIYKLLKSIPSQWGDIRYRLELGEQHKKDFLRVDRSKNKWKRWIVFCVLLVMIVLAYVLFGEKSNYFGILTIIRSILFLVLWFVFIGPLIMKWIQQYLLKKQQSLSVQIASTMDVFPHLLWILDTTWKETKSLKGIRRWKTFVTQSLLTILQFRTSYDPSSDRPNKEL